jgi:hypothetical protein
VYATALPPATSMTLVSKTGRTVRLLGLAAVALVASLSGESRASFGGAPAAQEPSR